MNERFKKWRATLWAWGTFPNHRGYVGIDDEGQIKITLIDRFADIYRASDGIEATITRRDARMLARRINQCLDATR